MSTSPKPLSIAGRFFGHNLLCLLSGGFFLPGGHRLCRDRVIADDFFGICVASSPDAECDAYVIERLRDLDVRCVRLDFTYSSEGSYTERFLNALLDEKFDVCLHLVQPREAVIRGHSRAEEEWPRFVARVVDLYGSRLDMIEIGSTCNRTKWTGHTLCSFLTAWQTAFREAGMRGVTVAGPNVTDFEPVYNVGLLGYLRGTGCLPAVHTDNLFVERAREPEAYDHKILGRFLAPVIKFDVVKKANILKRISDTYGIAKTMCSHVAWSERRIRRVLGDPWQKQADYLQRYLCLAAASGALDRVYWGPMIGHREGIIDDGTMEYPATPRVTLYEKAYGDVSAYRIRHAFKALRTVVGLLSGTRFNRRISRSNDHQILEFLSDEARIHAIWTMDGFGFDVLRWYDAGAVGAAKVVLRDGENPAACPRIIGERPVFLIWKRDVDVEVKAATRVMNAHRFHHASGVSYVPVSDGRWQGVIGVTPAWTRQDMAGLCPEELVAAPHKRILRDSRNTVWSCALPGVGRIVVKRFQTKAFHKRLLARWKPSRAQRSWNGASELLRRGILTPAPLGYFQAAHKPSSSASYYVCEEFPLTDSVRKAFYGFRSGQESYAGVSKPEFYQTLCEFISLMHGRGVYFRDLSAGNVLFVVTPERKVSFALIDTARARFYDRAIPMARRLADLRRICHPLGWDDRVSLLSTYMQRIDRELRPWMRWPLVMYDLKHRTKNRLRWREKTRG